jgi:flagellar M-ring protein FliF
MESTIINPAESNKLSINGSNNSITNNPQKNELTTTANSKSGENQLSRSNPTTIPDLVKEIALGFPNGFSQFIAEPYVVRLAPFIGTALIILAFTLYIILIQSVEYRSVMPGLIDSDQQAAFEILKTANFKPKIDTTTGQLQVPVDRYHEARMMLAGQGIPKTTPNGVDALKDSTSMTTSQFMEQVRYNSAIEQELVKSILQISTIQAVRVHLATPKQSVFVRDRLPPKASVVVTSYPGRIVAPQQVQAIVHLISSSIPYLMPENVTVVDSLGKLLTESATEGKLGLTAAQSQHKSQLEENYREKILSILSPIVGERNVRAQVSLDLDFTQIESTTEDFDSRDKGPRTRSESLAEDRQTALLAEGIPGSLSNKPPSGGPLETTTATDQNQAKSLKQTRNYELDRTVKYVRNAVGQIQRLSVAVLINSIPITQSNNSKSNNNTFTDDEINRMQNLVRGVVGYDQSRGDVVTLVPARFGQEPELDQRLPWYQDPVTINFIKLGAMASSFIIFLLVIVWPLTRYWIKLHLPEPDADLKMDFNDGELSPEDIRMIQIGEGETLEEIKAKLKPKKSAISAEMLDTANTYDDKVALIRMLVAEDSARVASVLKNMIKIV